MTRTPQLALSAVAALILGLGACAVGMGGQAGASLDAALEARLDSLSDDRLDSIYGRPARALWIGGNGLRNAGESAIEALEASMAQGIDPVRYELDRFSDDALRDASASELAAAEIELTRTVALMAQDVGSGVVASTGFDPGWQIDSLDTPALPAGSGDGQAILAHIESLSPSIGQYARLERLLTDLRELQADGGWPTVDALDGSLDEGDSSPVVEQVRARLAASLSTAERELAAAHDDEPAVLDAQLKQAISSFQARHDVEQDGVLGPETIEAMNASVDDRIEDVSLALERWRWLPVDLGEFVVLVNTAGRRVHVLRDGEPELTMKAIVGRRDWKTALFQDEMEQIVVNPYWNVPENILVEEVAPKAREDDEYLERNNFEVLDTETEDTVPADDVDWDDVEDEDFHYRVRQKPGPLNALGSVKFLFPNNHAIYLHDTPGEEKFDERLRDFSHGCVRVEHPAELAHLILAEASSHDPGRYEELMSTGEQHVLELDRHVPTYIVYQTVWVEDDGAPIFAPDIYDLDAPAKRALSPALGVVAGGAQAGGPS